ncbi:nodulation efficiency family protein [Teredinibacter turnerae T7901]|uniref:Nodulation efficiency family protein n=1 Tax=Teredinibacter turnerae (strain ATCC 39867 / T7901) TaxID=377629 RepID=C5BI00_TERTT|nr:NfeD family protein [Teredinibacter turnerae]ACR13634.1 nodulation efficiency family protein [Teredinibacter turnerae T7901]
MNLSILSGPWFWVALGLALLALELLGAGGFLLAIGVASLIVAMITFFVPMGWVVEFAVFGVLSVICTFVYWRYLKPNSTESEDPLLNNRVARLVGSRAVLIAPVVAGQGRVQIHDALWTVECDEPLPQGALVEITGYHGSTLTAQPVS